MMETTPSQAPDTGSESAPNGETGEGADAAAPRPRKVFKPGDKFGDKGGKFGDKKGDKFGDKAKLPSERIAKVLARAGLASRREVERLIGLGKIAVNGRILETPAVLVTSADIITVEGQQIGKAEPTRLWRYHKPIGLMTTHSDPQGRPTVFEKLPQPLPRVISVGRLDLNSEGLLLLTNDGELARALEMPSTAWVRRYRARALGNTSQAELDRLKDGTTVEGVIYGPMEATLDKKQDKADGRANVWLTVAITEGKNREVRKVLESIGLKVNRLIRLAYGPFQLGNLEPGEVEEVGPRVIRELLSDKIDPRNMPIEGVSQTRDAPRLRSEGTAGAGRRSGGDRFGKGRDEAVRAPRERQAGDGPRMRRTFEDKRVFAERDFDERPRFEGDGEARDRRPQSDAAPRDFTPREGGEKRAWTPRPERAEREGGKPAWTPRPERSEGGERSDGDRKPFKKPYRPGGDRSSMAPRDGAPRDGAPRDGGARDGNRSYGERRPFTSREDRGAPPAGEAGAYERAKREFGGQQRNSDDRPQRSFDDRPKRDFGAKSYADRPQRSNDDRPKRDFNDRPKRDFGDKPYGDRPQRSGDDRPKRDFGAKSYGDRPQRSFDAKPYGDRPKRDFNDRPKRDFGDKPYGDRPQRSSDDRPKRDFGAKSYGDRPQRSFDAKPYGDRPKRDFNDRPKRDFGDKPSGDRPQRSFEDRPKRDFSEKREGGYSGRGYKGPGGDRPAGDRPTGDRPSYGDRPRPANSDYKPGGYKSGGGKPGGFKSSGPRSDRPSSDGFRGGGYKGKPGGAGGARPGGFKSGGKPGGGSGGFGGKPRRDRD